MSKDIDNSIWNVAPILFRPVRAGDKQWMNDRFDAYFQDTMFLPGFVQDGYMNAMPPGVLPAPDAVRHLENLVRPPPPSENVWALRNFVLGT